MTTLAATVVPMQTPYIFWLATWDNLPIPPGQPLCCRITRATLEIDLTPTICWSIPLNNIIACERHVHHEGGAGLYLYAHLTVEATDETTSDPVKDEIFLGALDPISKNWDWKETLNLITLINQLRQHKATSIHANPYYRALERRGRLLDFTPIVYPWDALLPPALYEQHSLPQERRRQPTRAIGAPLLFGTICIVLVALLCWLEASYWIIINCALGLLPLALASFWPDHTYRRCQRMFYQFLSREFPIKEVNSKSTV